MSQNAKERIEYLEYYTGRKLSEIARLIGLKSPQAFYDIKKGKCGISVKLANTICEYYDNINREWLLTGEGNVLNGIELSEERDERNERSRMVLEFESHYVPVLPTSAHGGSLQDYSISVQPSDCEYAISPIAGADMIIPVLGDSMAPEYGNGSRVVVKKVNEKAFLEWGRVYVLDTVNGPVIKEIRKGETDDELVCVSLNPDPKYAPFSVRREDILGVYRVLMCMTLK